eukprot:7337826-Lingulodinium_polyedra.AAC.1
MERAIVRFASRCARGRPIRPHCCVTKCKKLHNDAIKSTARRRNGSLTAHSRTPRTRHVSGARVGRASM